jgi:hypothetical protein
LYISSQSENIPIGRRVTSITNLISKDGEPLKKWVNLFKLPATDLSKENYSGRIKVKALTANTDNKRMIDLVKDENVFAK